jgi:hypothetical protein
MILFLFLFLKGSCSPDLPKMEQISSLIRWCNLRGLSFIAERNLIWKNGLQGRFPSKNRTNFKKKIKNMVQTCFNEAQLFFSKGD